MKRKIIYKYIGGPKAILPYIEKKYYSNLSIKKYWSKRSDRVFFRKKKTIRSKCCILKELNGRFFWLQLFIL